MSSKNREESGYGFSLDLPTLWHRSRVPYPRNSRLASQFTKHNTFISWATGLAKLCASWHPIQTKLPTSHGRYVPRTHACLVRTRYKVVTIQDPSTLTHWALSRPLTHWAKTIKHGRAGAATPQGVVFPHLFSHLGAGFKARGQWRRSR